MPRDSTDAARRALESTRSLPHLCIAAQPGGQRAQSSIPAFRLSSRGGRGLPDKARAAPLMLHVWPGSCLQDPGQIPPFSRGTGHVTASVRCNGRPSPRGTRHLGLDSGNRPTNLQVEERLLGARSSLSKVPTAGATPLLSEVERHKPSECCACTTGPNRSATRRHSKSPC